MNKKEFGTLYVVGLPIGNPKDISYRAEEYLKNLTNVVVENKTNFIKLLKSLNIQKNNLNMISIEAVEGGEFYESAKISTVLDLLNSGEDVYIVSDDGMPGIADPGQDIIRKAIKHGVHVSSTPGPSIAVAASIVTGTGHNFLFDSFLPISKEERLSFLSLRNKLHVPIIFVLRNSSHKDGIEKLSNEIPELLEELCIIFGEERRASLCYNLTTNKEKVIRGSVWFLNKYFKNSKREISDQITIVIDIKNGNMPV